MQVQEIITRLREDYLDDTLGVDEDDSLVTDTSLLRFADEAQKQACRRGNFIYDETTATVCTIQLVEDQRAYPFDQNITVLQRVSFDGTDLNKTTEEALQNKDSNWRTADSSDPTCFYVRGRTIYVYPVPSLEASAKTLDLSVYRYPISSFRSDKQSFEIFEEAQDDLIYWMLYRVYNLRDEDLNDPTAAAYYYSLFQEVYGEVVPARVRIHQFESPETLVHTTPDGYSFTNGSTQTDPDFDTRGW